MRIIPTLAAGAAMAALAACSATANDTSYGGIMKIDAKTHTVTLYNGSVFQFDANADLSKWKAGDDVVIAYTTDPASNKKLAQKIATYCFCVRVDPFA